MRCGCYLLVATIALFAIGIQGIVEAAKFQKKQTVECKQFLSSPPKEGWFQIKNCRLDLTDASYKKSKYSEEITTAYIPIHMENEPKDAKIRLLLETKDPALLGTIGEMQDLDRGDEKAARQWVMKNVARIVPTKTLEGMVRHGDSKMRGKVLELTDTLDPDFVVLKEGERPSLGAAIGFVIGGVVCAGLCLLVFLGRFGGGQG